MSGIIFPKDWREIVKTKKVIKKHLITVSTERLEFELKRQLNECLKTFGNNKFCIALSGGLDSSVLAVLLKNLNIDFIAVTIGYGKNHPDIISAKKVTRRFKINHDVYILKNKKISDDIYDDLFAAISTLGFSHSIHGDTVDEMLGGYWLHKDPNSLEEIYCGTLVEKKRKLIFQDYWRRLILEHLIPLDFYARKHSVVVGLPYLATHKTLRKVEMSQRANNKKEGKIILKKLATKLHIPDEIINRKKLGLCHVWDTF